MYDKIQYKLKKKKRKKNIWLLQILVAACGIFSCSIQKKKKIYKEKLDWVLQIRYYYVLNLRHLSIV